ncbi:MAG TPA: cyclopropane-fatty-acyl-phospholipid synthase family protein [Candidatus Limnocylindrales bacterium]|nr:cyclopropane-fatty-acyl-phospholipid synthase family protein [Candidatus Limnocylindrales bacterium]
MSGDGLIDTAPDRPAAGPRSSRRRSRHAPRGGEVARPRPVRPLDRWLVSLVRKGLGPLPARMVLWDGSVWPLDGESPPPVADLVMRDRRALFGLVRHPALSFGESYMTGAIEVRGDLLAFLEAVYRRWEHTPYAARPRRVLRLGPGNTLRAARENVHRHYDLGNEFYRLWLDRELLYTCAYYPTPSATLEEAQVAKMEQVCRKLRLRAGERVLEAGCGWGSLALYMARTRGVQVRACNVSSEQIRYARERARAEGLAGRVEFVEDDYRNMDGAYDAFVSVGMLEHVGPAHYAALGGLMDRCLPRERGRGLLHFIGRDRPGELNPWIRKRIFPGAYPPVLREVLGSVLEPWRFSVLDVENLRLHYARTLGHWGERFESAAARVGALFDEAFVRTWRLYLAGSQASFTTGYLQLFQVVFARSGDNDVGWTRAELYR